MIDWAQEILEMRYARMQLDFSHYDTPTSVDRRRELPRDFGPRGLMVRDPYATRLLDGEKSWEIRGRATQIRGPVVIIKSGTGHAFGTVVLKKVLGPLSVEDLLETDGLPEDEKDEIRSDGLPYRKTYAYVFEKPQWFERPVPYHHPSGAVTWVRLPELDLSDIPYAA